MPFETSLLKNRKLNRAEAWDRLNYWLNKGTVYDPKDCLSIVRLLVKLLRADEAEKNVQLFKIERAIAGCIDGAQGWDGSFRFPNKYPREEAEKIVTNAQKPVVYRMVPA